MFPFRVLALVLVLVVVVGENEMVAATNHDAKIPNLKLREEHPMAWLGVATTVID